MQIRSDLTLHHSLQFLLGTVAQLLQMGGWELEYDDISALCSLCALFNMFSSSSDAPLGLSVL